MSAAIDRGGPFGRLRRWWRAPASAARCPDLRGKFPAESSPIDGSATRRSQRFAIVALALALVAFAQGGYIVAKADLGQWLLERAWQRTQQTRAPAKPWPWADMHPVARLIVPAQHADVIALSGATGRTLAWGPGHLDGSARAGDAGNAVFTAHRDTHFAFLEHATIGERIVVERSDGTRAEFRIAGMSVVAASALRLRARTDAPTLTLVTCYPFDAIAPNTPWRYVVSATLVSPAPASATTAIRSASAAAVRNVSR
jgi:sortase A